jgi:hypothetical protein
MHIVLARSRVACFVFGMLLVLASPLHHLVWVSWVGVAMLLVSLATTFIPGGVERDPVPVHSPVAAAG